MLLETLEGTHDLWNWLFFNYQLETPRACKLPGHEILNLRPFFRHGDAFHHGQLETLNVHLFLANSHGSHRRGRHLHGAPL